MVRGRGLITGSATTRIQPTGMVKNQGCPRRGYGPLLIADYDFIGDQAVAVEMVDDRHFFCRLYSGPTGRRGTDPEHRAVRRVIGRARGTGLSRELLSAPIDRDDCRVLL